MKNNKELEDIVKEVNLDKEDAENLGINIYTSDDEDEKEKVVEKLRPEWKNEPTFDDLNNDFTEAMNYHEEFKAKLLTRRKNFEGGPDIEAPKGNSLFLRTALASSFVLYVIILNYI